MRRLEAADQAGEAVEIGDLAWLQGLLLACPALRDLPFTGAAAAGVLSLMAGHDEDGRQLLRAAAEQGTDTQRRALAGRLHRLARIHPEHVPAVTELASLQAFAHIVRHRLKLRALTLRPEAFCGQRVAEMA